jgi:outer membrane protein
MLRITTTEVGETVTVKLEGKLAGPWAEEFERCCRSSADIYKNKRLIIDLTGVTYVDNGGKKLLCSLSKSGVQLIGSGILPNSLIEEICSQKQEEKDGKTHNRVKHSMLSVLLLIVCPIFMAKPMNAQEAPLRLSLHDAISVALKENPDVQIGAINIAESQQDHAIARSAIIPQAGFDIQDRAERFNLYAQFGSRFPGIPEHAGPFQFFQANVSVTMPIFDLTLWRQLQASRQGMNATSAQETTVREQIVLLVVSQYLAGMRADAAVQAAQSRVDLAQALFNQADDLQKHGVGTGIDTLRSNVELQNEKQGLLQAQTEQKLALYGLARLLNLDPNRQLELADAPSFYETPQLDTSKSLEDAYGTRPEMKALEARAHIAELTRRGASESRLPKVNFSGTVGQQGLSAPGAIPDYIYQVSLDVPIFTGGRIRAEMVKANLELKKVDQERNDLKSQIALEVKSSAAQLDAAQHEVDVANLGVKLAQEEVSQARDRFQAGVANNIEVISAQDALARANDNQIAALYGYNQARADLSHAIGQIEGLYSK